MHTRVTLGGSEIGTPDGPARRPRTNEIKNDRSTLRPRFEIPLAVAIVLFSFLYFSSGLSRIRNAPLSVDEVFVLWMVRDIPASQVAHAVGQGLEWLPPTYYFFLKDLCAQFGISPTTLRLPSVLAFYICMLTTFVVLRRYFNSAVAAFAAVLPGLLEPGLAAVLARPYTIMTACFLLNAALWLEMDSQRHPWWCAAGMAGLFALAVSVHFNSVFFVVPFAGMELARTLRTRKWRWPCWIAFCAGGSSIFLFWPVISATYQTTLAATASRGFYARPSVASLVQALGSLIINRQASLLLWMFLWICAIYFVIYSNSPNSGVADELPSKPSRYGDDLNLSALGSLLFPVVMLLVGIWGTHVFNGRYTYPFIFGLSVLIARITSYLPYASRLCTLMVWMVGMLLWLMVPGGSKPDARLEAISSAHENLPILASEASDFFELQESAPKPLKQRLFYSQMPAGVPNNDFDPERIAIAWQKFRPMQVVRAEDFFARWPRFYLLYPSTDRERMGSWILEHAKATVVSHSGIQYLFEISDLHQ